MINAHVTLHDYETAERAMAHENATTGVVVHGTSPCWSPPG